MTDIDFSVMPEPEPVPDFSATAESKPTTKRRRNEKTESKPDPKPIPPKLKINDENVIRESLASLYTTIGLGVSLVDMPCGTAIVESGEACTDAWLELARSNDAVRKALLSLTQASGWSAVLVAHAPIMLAVSQHHMPMFRMPSSQTDTPETPERMDIFTSSEPAPDWS